MLTINTLEQKVLSNYPLISVCFFTQIYCMASEDYIDTVPSYIDNFGATMFSLKTQAQTA